MTIDGTTTLWDLWWSGYKKKRVYGVAIAVRSKRQIVIEDVCQVSPRLMYIACRCYGMKLRVVSAHVPQEGRPESEKNSFYKQLNDTYKVNKGFQLVLAGDMNETAEYCVSFVGATKCEVSDANDVVA